MRFTFEGSAWFGTKADWSENYFANDFATRIFTGGRLPHSHNVDVTWLDTNHITYVTNYCFPAGMEATTPLTIFDKQVQKCFPRAKPVKDGDYFAISCGEAIFMFKKVNGEYRFVEIGVND